MLDTARKKSKKKKTCDKKKKEIPVGPKPYPH